MDTLINDIRYGYRMLVKSPAFTAIAVLALALGIGANTALFSVVNALLFHPFRFPEMNRIVTVWETIPTQGVEHNEASVPNYLDWRAQNSSFENLGGYSWWSVNVSSVDPPERVQGFLVSGNFFQVFGATPILGRTFTVEDEQAGRDKLVILSYGFWQRHFGGDPNIINKTLQLNNISRTVVGVMPREFDYPAGSEMWAPYPLDQSSQPDERHAHFWLVVGRLKSGAGREQAESELNSIAANLEGQYPDSNTGRRVTVIPFLQDTIRNYRAALLILLAAVGFVLLIACANVANLMLARAAARQKEMAIRTALGAGRLRIVRQLITESTLLALLGGFFGVLFALWGIDLLVSLFPAEFIRYIPGWSQIGINREVLLFTLGVSVLTGIFFGLFPAIQASRPNLNETLKEGGGKGINSGGRSRLRSILVVAEFALSLMLLIGAGLMMRSFARLMDVRPGFNPDNVLTMSMTLPRAKYKENEQAVAFYRQLLERVRALPGVRSASVINIIPLAGSNQTTLLVLEGRPEPPHGQEPEANFRTISPDYFQTMEIPLIKGRPFTEQDTAESTPAVIINETIARKFWPNEDPVGKRIRNAGPTERNPWLTIVGVAADIKRELAGKPESEIYQPHAQVASREMTVVARTENDPLNYVQPVRSQVQALDPNQPVYGIATMEQVRSSSVFLQRIAVTLLTAFAIVALVLAAVGIYGVMAYSVAQRTHEIGIRMALGAQRRDVLKLVVGQGMMLALIGAVIGLAAAFAVTRLMSSLLFGVSATDPTTFAGITLILSFVAFIACYIPARRAMKVDPMVALRYE
ncbi:MAG TPA: ABC transporter permease [Pyrinomonadaceae bacterium]|nr:ABC transporter permease [Pyrinomonadaceae bacterium]